MLYDTMEDKIKGTFMILQLARNPDNLEPMASNGPCQLLGPHLTETLLGVLSRLLKEDGKQSMDLAINVRCTLLINASPEPSGCLRLLLLLNIFSIPPPPLAESSRRRGPAHD